MQKKLQKFLIVIFSLAILFVCSNSTFAQKDSIPKKRLMNPAQVSGYIGGEAHNSYVIRARKGQIMSVQISWKREDENRAEFTVSRYVNFYSAQPVGFGKTTNNGKHWRGRISKTGNYYIYVVAHPSARYTLKVTLK